MGVDLSNARLDSFASNAQEQSFVFSARIDEWQARSAEEVVPLLERVEQAVEQGLHAVGYLSYEAAKGLSLKTRAPGALPLAYFATYAERRVVEPGQGLKEGEYNVGEWKPSIERRAYDEALAVVREYLAAGDSYQVNFTFRLRASFTGEPQTLYGALCRAQAATYGGYLDMGRHVLLSASPELFWRLDEGVLTTRPMKGTCARGRWPDEDRHRAAELVSSLKERAENVMVTDMLRNDLGRISEVGSVEVPELFKAERYPTLWQLTSTVQSRLKEGVGLAEIFAALFPCASVTGAPKVRTMEIIAELEQEPRGIYTGCLGYISPGQNGPEACFNVAIRTAHLDRETGALEFGVGGGVTWGSSAEGEYGECLLKAQVLSARRPIFRLLETLLWEEGAYFLLQRHLQRLADSADYWDFSCDLSAVEQHLNEAAKAFGSNVMLVRLLVDISGQIEVQASPLTAAAPTLLPFRLAHEPVDSRDVFLYHKTTRRAVYEESAATAGGEALLYNERDELTEFCMGNVVLKMADGAFTPPVDSGLLAGTFRAALLERGEIAEKVLKIEDLKEAESIYLINSVRRWTAAELI